MPPRAATCQCKKGTERRRRRKNQTIGPMWGVQAPRNEFRGYCGAARGGTRATVEAKDAWSRAQEETSPNIGRSPMKKAAPEVNRCWNNKLV